jgi:PDZ domain-containing secreted protein
MMSAAPTGLSSSPGDSFGFFNKGIMTGFVFKKTQDERLGVGFRDTNNGVVLGKLVGRFESETELVSGLKVLHVNGNPVDSAQQAAILVRSVGANEAVSVAVDGMCVQANKKRRSDKPGISLEQMPNGGIKIQDVSIKGYFPTLQPGQTLLAINGKTVSTMKEATKVLNQSKQLSLVVLSEEEDMSDTSSRAMSFTGHTSSVADELDLLKSVHFQMQDFDEDEYNDQ